MARPDLGSTTIRPELFPRRRSRVPELQFFAGPPRAIPTQQGQPITPSIAPPRHSLVHELQFFAGPPMAILTGPRQPIAPEYLPHRVRAPVYEMPSIAMPREAILPIVPAFGEPGAATFILSLEPGTKVVYSWSTDIFTSYTGLEQRSSPFGTPRQRFEGVAFLLDAGSRDVRGALQRAAARGAIFLLALPYEELALIADSIGTQVSVATTAGSDWLQVGQRVAVIGVDGTTITAVVQQVAPTRIRLDVEPKAVGRAGARILPLIQVLLDPAQGFSRYPIAVDLWSVRARAAVFGWAGLDVMGLGASITTLAAGHPVPIASITDAELLIWDRLNAIDGTATEAMLSGAETLDLGALPVGAGAVRVPDWTRTLRYRSSSADDWQWIKAFLRLCRGRQRAFLLPTNRDDLVLVGKTARGVQVRSAGDYASWFASAAHRRLAVTLADGTLVYATVTVVVDNGDGTLSLTLSSAVTGTIAKLSLLEQVRLEGTGDGSDEIEVTWDGGTFAIELTVVAVQA